MRVARRPRRYGVIDTVPWMDRIAHDLRGPLTPLQTAAYLLRSGQVSAERQQELFVLIERQTRQLVRMIDELGDWARVGKDRLLNTTEPCDPALLLDYARTNSGAGDKLSIDNRADGRMLDGDPLRLTQLLRVLIEFATARATCPADIVIDAIDGQLRIDIRSQAPAPGPTPLRDMFEAPQADAYDQGLGLQLLIARAIAEAHGGTLAALADDGRLLLRCTLPLAPA